MENHVRVIYIEEWVMYLPIECYAELKQAMVDKEILETINLFGAQIVLNGEHIREVFISTVESRARYAEFDKLMKAEEEETEDPSWK